MLVELWTDGSTDTNPGPGGWGCVLVIASIKAVVMLHGRETETTTNNRMELEAIRRGLMMCPDDSHVLVKSDSSYALGAIFNRSWRLSKNVELISSIRQRVDQLPGVQGMHVKGHSGVEWNEMAHQLAGSGYYSIPGRPDLGEYQLTAISFIDGYTQNLEPLGDHHHLLRDHHVPKLDFSR